MRRKPNYWRTADVRLHRDSQGYYEATHPYAGTLFESDYFETRAQARSEAVRILRQKKQENTYDR